MTRVPPTTLKMSHSPKTKTRIPESGEQFRQMVEAVLDYAIFMLDKTGRVITWNAGAARIKGYKASDIIGKHFSIFYPEAEIHSRKPERELEAADREGRFED